MATTKILSLTLEQAEELVNALSTEEITSVEASESKSFFNKVKQNFRNGIDGLRQKLSGKDTVVTETVTEIVEEPAQAVENITSEMGDSNNATQRMTDHEYRCYLNSVVFGE